MKTLYQYQMEYYRRLKGGGHFIRTKRLLNEDVTMVNACVSVSRGSEFESQSLCGLSWLLVRLMKSASLHFTHFEVLYFKCSSFACNGHK